MRFGDGKNQAKKDPQNGNFHFGDGFYFSFWLTIQA
jgi:hypothetical protein